MEKNFEIARFRNNRGSVKLVTMNHFFVKYSTVWRKTPIKEKCRNYMSDKSADAVVLKNLWMFCCFWFFSNTFVDRERQLACLPSNLGSLNSKQTVAWESFDCLMDFTLCWSLGSFFLFIFISTIAVIHFHPIFVTKLCEDVFIAQRTNVRC